VLLLPWPGAVLADRTLLKAENVADQERKEKAEQFGMQNLRDPVTRAAVCSSCHVGSPSEGKVVTHAMYAAGHPPLTGFELNGLSERMPPHWRKARDVPSSGIPDRV